jgi:hypothetical protein
MQISLFKKYEVPRQNELYAEYIKKTSELIGKPYMVTFKLVEKWEPMVMANLYDECVTKWRNRGYKSPSMMWWTERKKLSTHRKGT